MTNRHDSGSPGRDRPRESGGGSRTRLRLVGRTLALHSAASRNCLPADIPIVDLIGAFGLAGADAIEARTAIEAAGLTNPRKRNISRGKIHAVDQVLAARFQRLCSNCASRTERDNRKPARVHGDCCERCGGSNNGRATQDLIAAWRRANIRRALFVGGSPSFRQELLRLLGDDLELRLVDGTKRITKGTARNDIDWADVIVVCGATELAHKVSTLFTRDPAARKKLVVTARRGIEAIVDHVADSTLLHPQELRGA